MMNIIDQKVRFKAINPCNNKRYTEADAVIFNAKDPVLPVALEAYRDECVRLGTNPEHVKSIELCIVRIREFQEFGCDQTRGLIIDRKFIFRGQRLNGGDDFDESNAIIMCVKDQAFPAMLERYRQESIRQGVDRKAVDELSTLISRVVDYQLQHDFKIPDTVGQCEISRCIDGNL